MSEPTCPAQWEARALKAEEQRDNLLCRIHGDGGHYIAEHGVEKACVDADERVAYLNAEFGTLKEQRDTLLAAAKAVLASATPRQTWHPAMWKAWEQTRQAIRFTEPEFEI